MLALQICELLLVGNETGVPYRSGQSLMACDWLEQLHWGGPEDAWLLHLRLEVD